MSRVSKQTLLDRSNRNMASGTHPVVRESALELVSRAYDEGINVQISEGHRPNSRQNALYAQGRTQPGNIVTNARGGQSWHNYGIAVDFFLTSEDGKRAIWTVNSKWRRAAQIAKSLGFEWGGDWTGFVDYPHLQMTGGLTMAQMRAGRKPKLVSRVKNPVTPQTSKPRPAPKKWTKVTGNWTGQTLKRGQYGTPVRQLQELLASKHYYPNKGAKNNGVDGYFGADTLDAVKRYQSMFGLTVDGLPGKSTYASLKGVKAKSKSTGSWTGQTLRRGHRGKAVRQLQEMLAAKYYYPDKGARNNGVDGIYGAKTADAVRRYQTMHGLKVDGIAGRGTYNSLRK